MEPLILKFKSENEARRSPEFRLFLLGAKVGVDHCGGDPVEIDRLLLQFGQSGDAFDFPNAPRLIAILADDFANYWQLEEEF